MAARRMKVPVKAYTDPFTEHVHVIIEILKATGLGCKDVAGPGYRILADGSFEGFEPEDLGGREWPASWEEFSDNVDQRDLREVIEDLLEADGSLGEELRERAAKFLRVATSTDEP